MVYGAYCVDYYMEYAPHTTPSLFLPRPLKGDIIGVMPPAETIGLLPSLTFGDGATVAAGK